MNYLFSLLGFISVLLMIIGPVGACLFFLLGLFFQNPVRHTLWKGAKISVGIFFGGLLLTVLILFGHSAQNTPATPSTSPTTSTGDVGTSALTFGLTDDACPVQSLEVGKEFVFPSFWVKTDRDITATSYRFETVYDLGDGEVKGKWIIRKAGEKDVLASFSSTLSKKASSTTSDNDLEILNTASGDQKDQTFEFVFIPDSVQNIVPGKNTLTLLLPLNKWKFSEAIVPEVEKTFLGGLKTSCTF